jgi:hypothetical protein
MKEERESGLVRGERTEFSERHNVKIIELDRDGDRSLVESGNATELSCSVDHGIYGHLTRAQPRGPRR